MGAAGVVLDSAALEGPQRKPAGMLFTRVLPRFVAVFGWTYLCWGMLFLTQPLKLFWRRGQGRLRRRIFHGWARGLAWSVGMRVKVRGRPPAGRFLLVTNHLSYLDIILLATQVNVTFVAKADLRRWPGLGLVIATADTIFIDRERRRDVVRVMERMGRALDHGLGLLLFPEGTSGKGDRLLRFKPSLLEFAANRDMPVHFACIGYRAPAGAAPASESLCWWGDQTFLPHVRRMMSLPGFDAWIDFGDEPLHDPDRKALADKLRAAMERRFTPLD